MDRLDQELNSLFAAYRDATPDPEASAQFMPRLWEKIEAKRSFVFRLRRISQLAVAAALAACLLGGFLVAPLARQNQIAGSYVDILAEAHADDTLSATGGVRLDLLDAQQK
jgi:anti-sigma factor RsiW